MTRKNSTLSRSSSIGAPGGDSKGRHSAHVSARSPEIHGPRKHPKQARARETVAAILEAAAEVFAEKSYSGATTNKIAVRAGVSIGSLYQYFPNKDAILAALMEQHLSEVRTVVERSMIEMQDVTVPIHRALSSLLHGLMDLHDANPNLTRALSEDVVQRYLADATPQEMDESFTRETERLLRHRPDVRSGDYAVMADVLVQATEDLTRWLVHKAPATRDRRAYVEEVLRLLTRYVQSRPFRAAGREEFSGVRNL